MTGQGIERGKPLPVDKLGETIMCDECVAIFTYSYHRVRSAVNNSRDECPPRAEGSEACPDDH